MINTYLKNTIGVITIAVTSLLFIGSTSNTYAKEDYCIYELENAGVGVSAYVTNDMLSDDESGIDDEADIIYANNSGDYFAVEEFLEFDKEASNATISKIVYKHIPELEKVRRGIGKPIIIRSGARSYSHELKMGRSGKSQHVYATGDGAVDISTENYTQEDLNKIVYLLVSETSYSRITMYSTFVHVDFLSPRFGKRGYYKNTELGWVFIGNIM